MADWGELKGKAGSAAEQLFLWGILQTVIQALAGPALTDLQTAVNKAHPVTPLTAAEAATAANRSFLPPGKAAEEAAKQGIGAADFDVMRSLAGTAPSPTDLVTLLRRGLIQEKGTGKDALTFEQGIHEGNLLDKWTNLVRDLAVEWPTPAVAVDATLKGQRTPAEGKTLYEKFGGDPQWFDLVHATAGSAPTPLEAVEMALRGIIGWAGRGETATTYEQAFLEGPWRDKWQQAYEKFAYWYPTVSEALDLYRYGQWDAKQATDAMVQRGVSAPDAAAWIGYADANAVDQYRGLTESAILGMLSISYITDSQAKTMLESIHKGPAAVDQLIQYGHIQRAISSVNRAVDRVGSLYQARKITAATARDALTRIGVQAVAIPDIIADWDAVASINVKTLTESQIADAWEYGVLDEATALQELQNIGYTPFDAWVVLSVKNKGPLPGEPPAGPGAPLGAVTPGTT